VALVSTLVARAKDSSGLLWLAWQASFAHWALQACVIAEAERLTGAWATLSSLLRCASQYVQCCTVMHEISLN
jgi:ABC-2 type transporter